MPEESENIKETREQMAVLEGRLKELSTQQLVLLQVEIINELINRYNKEGGINPTNEESCTK